MDDANTEKSLLTETLRLREHRIAELQNQVETLNKVICKSPVAYSVYFTHKIRNTDFFFFFSVDKYRKLFAVVERTCW